MEKPIQENARYVVKHGKRNVILMRTFHKGGPMKKEELIEALEKEQAMQRSPNSSMWIHGCKAGLQIALNLARQLDIVELTEEELAALNGLFGFLNLDAKFYVDEISVLKKLCLYAGVKI
jgi:hypothetical protein